MLRSPSKVLRKMCVDWAVKGKWCYGRSNMDMTKCQKGEDLLSGEYLVYPEGPPGF